MTIQARLLLQAAEATAENLRAQHPGVDIRVSRHGPMFRLIASNEHGFVCPMCLGPVGDAQPKARPSIDMSAILLFHACKDCEPLKPPKAAA